MTGRRRFSDREKAALWVAAGGECEACGDPIFGTWHGDHIEAYSLGGVTDVTNGQALCPPCNLKKGDGVVLTGGWPVSEPLRQWQNEAFGKFLAMDLADFLCVATPGSGKTRLALRIAHHLFQQGAIERVVVVVPTDHLREQWKDAAASVCGIQLQRDWKNRSGQETSDFDGVVVTYQAVASAPLVYRTQCSRQRTLVILDEIHHAGDSLSWGNNIRQAFEPASRRLLLSGTPFRSDGKTIPFVRYEEDGRCRADHSYGYGDAITDQVCRAVMFPRFDGEMRWWSDRGLMTATFRDDIPQEEASRRLRTALDVSGDWLRDVLRDADAQLTEIRAEGHHAAGGLVVCIDQAHARDIAVLLQQITGERPTLAISEDVLSSVHIKRFEKSSDRWIVAVKMVSEGVDIPRLRVGVYATNVISVLFFRQVVGRFVRKQTDVDEQVAYLFIPDDETLAQYAEQIKVERDDAIGEVEQTIEREQRDESGGSSLLRMPSIFTPGTAGPAELTGITADGTTIGRVELDRAIAIARDLGRTSRDDAIWLAQALRRAGVDTPGASEAARREPSANDQRQALREVRKIKVNTFGSAFLKVARLDARDGYPIINRRLNDLCGKVRVEDATIAQLQHAIRLLDIWTRSLHAALTSGATGRWAAEWERGVHDGESADAAAGA